MLTSIFFLSTLLVSISCYWDATKEGSGDSKNETGRSKAMHAKCIGRSQLVVQMAHLLETGPSGAESHGNPLQLGFCHR